MANQELVTKRNRSFLIFDSWPEQPFGFVGILSMLILIPERNPEDSDAEFLPDWNRTDQDSE